MKIVSPYRHVAKEALMSWNGLSEEEARKVALESTKDELENQVWATSSMQYAVLGLGEYVGLDEELRKEFESAVLGQDDPAMTQEQQEVCNKVAQIVKTVDDLNKMVVSTLEVIHDNWVKDNAKKFIKEGRESKKYQHLPLQMIGWKEAKADLLFLNPILKSIGVELNQENLKDTYDQSVKEFFEANEFITDLGEVSISKVSEEILKGSEFYAPLTEVNTAKNIEEAQMVADQVKSKTDLKVKKPELQD